MTDSITTPAPTGISSLMAGSGTVAGSSVPNPFEQFNRLTAVLHEPGLAPKRLGELGEDYGVLWLERRGWRIVDRNWRSRYGELDIIAVTPDDRLSFVEVKTRRNASFGSPQSAVNAHKRTTLRRAGIQWLQEHGRTVPHESVRFDVLAISVHGSRRAPQVQLIPGAF
ncbi:YraN family protein [Bifidobacterium callimiconis]|uniref:YraN family protein n=1 Tax=Bifidobacterium callimiconis TaxID=2306973 RepID=UPI001F0A248A|nr:YraN family protein [Bifidobacterium callimiconis]